MDGDGDYDLQVGSIDGTSTSAAFERRSSSRSSNTKTMLVLSTVHLSRFPDDQIVEKSTMGVCFPILGASEKFPDLGSALGL